ncbi:hypothetical protein DICPUDRAFT_81752 [Dictyostelium purpureum]|uniref:RING-type domain-containing protein n=1 Tax=Dictyostelium purpureum TaxID=5786 RepID=F0ZUG8_DICPU|nr:uncharacterized protein DICPUDRAFT_81752 [Dictyostelium purpureum]EGC32412.1 hypothetical protein DICPUDRAFT_81752 [Dictyostelium purpureum]|eukprot:XP_003291059.1 hypothetical protein DICPUDRAFT_81752 [Dictyostelium purpureum]
MTFSEDKRQFRYVDPLNEDFKHLECPLCKDPLEDPIVEPSCRNMVCRSCFETSPEFIKNSVCPICSKKCETIDQTTIPIFITKLLDNLRVKCKVCNSEQEIRRADFTNHAENFCKTQCKLGCGECLTKPQVQSHNQICKKFPVECSAKKLMCKWTGIREDLEEHEKKCIYFGLENALSFILEKLSMLEEKQNVTNSNLTTFKEKFDSKFPK